MQNTLKGEHQTHFLHWQTLYSSGRVHSLEQLDVAVFRFINGTLSNPFFDQLMPFVSRNPFSGPLRWPLIGVIVIFSVVVIRKRLCRVAICAAMAGIAIGVGDGLICRTIKHAVARPRPFNVLADVKRPGHTSFSSPMEEKAEARASPSPPLEERRPAETNIPQKAIERTGIIPPNPPPLSLNSMPSAHAANWFAGTMVALVYFRKSIRVMLPIACLVSFSRIYNGVHYPSDVLAGAALGAGTAAAVLWLFETMWQWCGPKWFPSAWKAMSSLTFCRVSNRSSPAS